MRKTKEKKIVYYKDELNDDFGGEIENQRVVDSSFKFVHKNHIWRFFSGFIYYVFAVPLLFFFTKLIKHIKVVNKKAVKKLKGQSYYLYGNHTSNVDVLVPSMISLPRRNKIITSPHALSIRGIKTLVQMLGAIPTPSGLNGMHKFVEAIDYYYKHGYIISIFPEAHIWLYYNKIRPFKDTSFGYPISSNSPVVAFCTTYQKPKGLFKNSKKPRTTIYVSEPFYPDLTKPKKVAQKELRDKVYNFMVETATKYSDYEYIKYRPYTESPEFNNQNKNTKC